MASGTAATAEQGWAGRGTPANGSPPAASWRSVWAWSTLLAAAVVAPAAAGSVSPPGFGVCDVRLAGAYLATVLVIGGTGLLGIVLVQRRSAAVRQAACLAAAGCLLAAPRLVALNQPLLDFHDFRQTQTALTAYWFAAEGVTLPAYPLPVLGRPWTAPFEFPLYQLVAAAVHRLGVPLDAACRGTALVAFVAAILVFIRVLLRHGAPPFVAAVVGVLALSSPFALVWSKASLIEFTAVLYCVAFAGLAADADAEGLGVTRWLLLMTAGTAAALVKITTLVVFWPAVALFAADRLWRLHRERAGLRRFLVEAVAWGTALALPVLAGQAWVAATDAVKAAAEPTTRLTSENLRGWTHGTLAQRLDYRTWRAIAHRIGTDVLPYVWLLAVYGVLVLRRLPRRIALLGWGTLAGACGVVPLFFNLYVVHDYYLCAVVVPLWLAAAAGAWGVAEKIRWAGARRLVLPVMLVLMIVAAARSFMVRISYGDFTHHELLAFCRDVRSVVPADAELVVVGDEWNPRVPYYTQRRAFTVWTVLPGALVRDYVSKNGVRDLVVRRTGDTRALEVLPGSDLVLERGEYELRRLRSETR